MSRRIELLGTRLGRPTLSDGSGGRKGGIMFRVYPGDGAPATDRVIPWGPEGQGACRDHAWVAARLRELERQHGITGWYWNRDQGPSTEPVSATGAGSKPRQLWSLCIHHPGGDSWHSAYGLCGRPVAAEGANGCGPHAAGQARSEASMAAHRARWDEQSERRRRAIMLTGDLTDLWNLACDEMGVEPERRGAPRVDEAGRAVVDHEVLSTMLRRIIG